MVTPSTHTLTAERSKRSSIQSRKHICRVTWTGVAQGGLVLPVLFSLYVKDTPTPPRPVDLAQCRNTALVTTRRSPSLLVACLEDQLRRWSYGYVTGGMPSA